MARTFRGWPSHNEESWNWVRLLSGEVRLIFSRYTQVGLLRLLTSRSVMGEQTLTLREAWSVYDRWLTDPRVEFYPEARGLDTRFREATTALSGVQASKWIGDCYLLAFASQSNATLVTFDKSLLRLARKEGYSAILPG